MSKADWRGFRKYQKKKEKGLIIEKPCNVGDPVWYIEDGRIVPSVVELIEYTQSRIMAEPHCGIVGPGFDVLFSEVGTKLFLSIEAAEAALTKKSKEEKEQLLTKIGMNYRCNRCNKKWIMWLQTGLEEGGENHKPVPFGIRCKCGGTAFHIDWHKDIKLATPSQIESYMNYFANIHNEDCGQPVLR